MITCIGNGRPTGYQYKESNMYGYIYLTTFTPTGKIYVGKKVKDKFDRNYFGSGIKIKNLIKKYGKKDFESHIIDEATNESELNEKERYWIAYYSSTDPSIGYNIALGGNGAQLKSLTQETKDKISKANGGKRRSDAVRDKMSLDRTGSRWINNGTQNKLVRSYDIDKYIYGGSEWHLGIKPGRKGYAKSEESKKKCSISNTGKKHSDEWNKHNSDSKKAKCSHWYTNGVDNILVPGNGVAPDGFYRGRTFDDEFKRKCGEKNKGRIPWNKK